MSQLKQNIDQYKLTAALYEINLISAFECNFCQEVMKHPD